MNEITISKTLWMNAVTRRLNPGSKTVAVVDYWYDREGSIHLKLRRPFDKYRDVNLTAEPVAIVHSDVNFTAETVAIVLGYKSVKFNRDYSITATE